MSPEDRKAIHQPSAEEAQADGRKRSEKQEHRIFSTWLHLHRFDLVARSDRMDKRTCGTVGWPDYEVFHKGKTLFLEFKVLGGKLSSEQETMIERLTAQGFIVAIPQTAEEAIQIARNWMATRKK
jgi:hypothetical protein